MRVSTYRPLFSLSLVLLVAAGCGGGSDDDSSDAAAGAAGVAGTGVGGGAAGTGAKAGGGASAKGGSAGTSGAGTKAGSGGASAKAGSGGASGSTATAGTSSKGGGAGTSAKGGAAGSTGGNGPSAGGTGPSAGGSGPSTGGSGPSTGGGGPSTGGSDGAGGTSGGGTSSAGGSDGAGGTSSTGGSGSVSCAVPVPDVQTPHPKGTTCAKLGYYDYVPAAYGTASSWPVIIAFHGDGERGDGVADLPLLLNNGLTKDIPEGKWDPKKRFVVLAPQMDDRNGKTERTAASVNDFVDFAIANYAIDPKRIYLTGLSGGGAPVYNYLGTYAGGVVAATNIDAGWYSTQNKECTWKDIPTWYFHSAMDNVVPPAQHTTVSYDNLIGCDPAPKVAPRYTMYANLGHSAWGPTYDLTGMDATKYPLVSAPPGTTPYDLSLYDWFLQYTR